MAQQASDPPSPPPEIVWPEIGQTYRDVKVPTRTLLIKEVHRISPLGRNVVGKLFNGRNAMDDGVDYACDMPIFQVVWRKQ